jgi:hypothetical protein
MYVNFFVRSDYENKTCWRLEKNEANFRLLSAQEAPETLARYENFPYL